MIKKLTIPVDHGNRNMKTTHFLFTTGLSSTDRKPAGREDFLQTDGKYYVLSGKRIPYQRDKTQDERFSILTRFAIAKELERTGQVSEEDVVQVSVFCQVLFPEKSVGIPFFQQGIFPAFSGHYVSLRMRACSIR